jgi:DNA-binding PadR family transcriptional regulator
VIPRLVYESCAMCRGAKLFFGLVARECERSGACSLMAIQLSEVFSVSTQTIKKWIHELVQGGYLERKRERRGEEPYYVIVDILTIPETFKDALEDPREVAKKRRRAPRKRQPNAKVRQQIQFITHILEPQ